jgi:AcrR family transcriptional regulator
MTHPSPTSRDQILDAAEGLFAAKGLRATTIKEIGTATGLNPALLYYYFAGKEELYQAVLERMVSGLVAQGASALDEPRAPSDAIRGLVRAQAEYLIAHPNLPRLLVRELLDHEARRAKDIILQVATGLFARLCRVIVAGQREGVFRADVEPRFAAVSTVSQVVYFALARPAVEVFFGGGPAAVSPEGFRAFARHAGEFAVLALATKEHA